jgi:hypothetical protein
MLASVVALAVASSASAAPSVSVFWEGTTGSSTIASSLGDTITMIVQLNPGAEGIAAAQLRLDYSSVAGTVSVFYDPTFDGITGGDAVKYTPAASGTYGGPALEYVSDSGCPSGVGEATGNFAAGFCGNNFQAVGGGGDNGTYTGPWSNLGSPGNTITNSYTLARVEYKVVPEPATVGLLALGLGAPAFIGRRQA